MKATGETRTCHICGTQVVTWCPVCTADFVMLADTETMSTEEKIQELEDWLGPLEIDFNLVHQRIEKLMGRPVWTHEMACPESLYAELRLGEESNDE